MPSFLDTPTGKLAQYRRRKRRRLHIDVPDIEPQSKRMADAQKDDFQRKVLGRLKQVRRAAFRGPVALSVQLSTTKATAPQAHTIAKNLLDLLGPVRPAVRSDRRHLLYKDDSQIHALSVSCKHGKERPMIAIEACPLREILGDLELAAEALESLEESDPDTWGRSSHEDEPLEALSRAIRDQAELRRLFGKHYDGILRNDRWSAQHARLTRAGLGTRELYWLFDQRAVMAPMTNLWDDVIRNTPIRIDIGELPTTPGSSAVFKQRIEAELTAFKKKWNWLISPLMVPVGLEVIVKPNPATPKAVLHDLDNIVRDYLLPQVVPKFGTVTDFRWTFDLQNLQRSGSDRAAKWGSLPKGTRDGVTHYQAWRLPPAPKGEVGYVSVALVADSSNFFQQIDNQIREWEETLDH